MQHILTYYLLLPGHIARCWECKGNQGMYVLCLSRRYWIIQEESYAFSLVVSVIKKNIKIFTFFHSRIFQIFLEHMDSNLPIHWVTIADLFSAHCFRINLDFKFDLGDNVILEIYKAKLSDNINFIFFLMKYS